MRNTYLHSYFSPRSCLDCILLEHSHNGTRLLPHYNDLISSALNLVEFLNELLEQEPLVAEVFDVFSSLGKFDAEGSLRANYYGFGILN